jgi:hypothetical protein
LGRRLRYWGPSKLMRPTMTLVRVWVDELWAELKTQGVNLERFEAEAKDVLHLNVPSPVPGKDTLQ